MTPIDLGPAAERMATVIRGVPPEHLDRPTPCEDYTVGDLLDHVATFATAFIAGAAKADPPDGPARDGDGAALAPDWQERLPAAVTELADAWRVPGAQEGMSQAGGFALPADVVAAVAVEELVIHGWDLARATGQDFDADDESAAVAIDVIRQFGGPGADGVRNTAWDAPRPAPAGASALLQAVAVSGRDPDWTPPAP